MLESNFDFGEKISTVFSFSSDTKVVVGWRNMKSAYNIDSFPMQRYTFKRKKFQVGISTYTPCIVFCYDCSDNTHHSRYLDWKHSANQIYQDWWDT